MATQDKTQQRKTLLTLALIPEDKFRLTPVIKHLSIKNTQDWLSPGTNYFILVHVQGNFKCAKSVLALSPFLFFHVQISFNKFHLMSGFSDFLGGKKQVFCRPLSLFGVQPQTKLYCWDCAVFKVANFSQRQKNMIHLFRAPPSTSVQLPPLHVFVRRLVKTDNLCEHVAHLWQPGLCNGEKDRS